MALDCAPDWPRCVQVGSDRSYLIEEDRSPGILKRILNYLTLVSVALSQAPSSFASIRPDVHFVLVDARCFVGQVPSCGVCFSAWLGGEQGFVLAV